MKRIIATTLALAVALVVTASAADKPEGKRGEGHRPMGLLPPPIVEKLTADQKTQYETIVTDFKKQMKDAAGDKEKCMGIMKESRKKVIDLLTDDQKAELKKIAPPHGKRGEGGKKPEGAPKPAAEK